MAGFSIKIGADASGYKNELNKMRSQTKAFSSKIGGIMQGAFALLSVGALRNIGKEFAEMGMAAKTLGMDTKEFTKFAQAAAAYGLDVGQVEDAFKDLNVKLQEAAAGNKGYQESFKAMGLDYMAATIAKPTEQMYLFGDALSKLGDDQKARMHMDEINDSMWRMSPLILRNRVELEKFVNSFKGLNQNEIDSIIEGEAAWKQLTLQLKVGVMPMLTAVAEAIRDIKNLQSGDMDAFVTQRRESKLKKQVQGKTFDQSFDLWSSKIASSLPGLGRASEQAITRDKAIRDAAKQELKGMDELVKATKETAQNTRPKPKTAEQ